MAMWSGRAPPDASEAYEYLCATSQASCGAASPLAETMLRGGLCRPVARAGVHWGSQRQFESDLRRGFGFRARSLTPGDNPAPGDSNRRCGRPSYGRQSSRPSYGRQSIGPQPGQGLGPFALGLLHQGTQERVLLWLVKRGGAESENSAPMGSELET